MIELLVVVAIIALLVTNLLSSLNKAREEAKRAVCRSNLHQIGIGIAMYVDEATPRGYVPGLSRKTSEHGYMLWHRTGEPSGLGWLIGDYVGDGKMFYCPSAANFSFKYENPLYGFQHWGNTYPANVHEGHVFCNYILRRDMRDAQTRSLASRFGGPEDQDWMKGFKLLEAGASRALVADNFYVGMNTSFLNSDPGNEKGTHEEGINILMSDWSVRWYTDPNRDLNTPRTNTGAKIDEWFERFDDVLGVGRP